VTQDIMELKVKCYNATDSLDLPPADLSKGIVTGWMGLDMPRCSRDWCWCL